MGYVIAAYTVVLGSLLVYGLRLQALRRGLPEPPGDGAAAEGPPR
jgi:hypothetical protein